MFEIVYVSCRVSALHSGDLFVMGGKVSVLNGDPPGALLMTGRLPLACPDTGRGGEVRHSPRGAPRGRPGTGRALSTALV